MNKLRAFAVLRGHNDYYTLIITAPTVDVPRDFQKAAEVLAAHLSMPAPTIVLEGEGSYNLATGSCAAVETLLQAYKKSLATYRTAKIQRKLLEAAVANVTAKTRSGKVL